MEEKKITLPIKVTIIGCIIGLAIASIGGVKQLKAKKIKMNGVPTNSY